MVQWHVVCLNLIYSINHPIGTVSELTNFTFLYFNLLWKILINLPNLLRHPLSKCTLKKYQWSCYLFQLIHQIRILNQNRQVEKEKVSVRKSSISSMHQSQTSNVPSYFSLSAQTSIQNCKSESSGQKRKYPWENLRSYNKNQLYCVTSYFSLSAQTSIQNCKSESSSQNRKYPWENLRAYNKNQLYCDFLSFII